MTAAIIFAAVTGGLVALHELAVRLAREWDAWLRRTGRR